MHALFKTQINRTRRNIVSIGENYFYVKILILSNKYENNRGADFVELGEVACNEIDICKKLNSLIFE